MAGVTWFFSHAVALGGLRALYLDIAIVGFAGHLVHDDMNGSCSFGGSEGGVLA